jgi:hypothetical protein
MKNLFSVVAVLLVACIALVSPPVKRAAADPPATDAGAPPAPSDCATCIQCVAGCTTAYADCTRKCLGQPDFKSQQTCLTQCPTVFACAQACPCSGCPNIPGLPH